MLQTNVQLPARSVRIQWWEALVKPEVVSSTLGTQQWGEPTEARCPLTSLVWESARVPGRQTSLSPLAYGDNEVGGQCTGGGDSTNPRLSRTVAEG